MGQSENPDATSIVAGGCLTFAELYDAHVDEVYRFVHRRCRDHALSEDITQETFVTAIRGSRDPSSISVGWLITVARNRLVDVLRRQTNYEGKLRLVGASESDDYDAQLAERMRIEAALNELSVEYRLVLTLRYIDGMSVLELADHLGRSAKSVEGLITRARRAMRRQLADDIDVDGKGEDHG
jgi:RNA polymerase sigma-70 factor (ECF subfamily)